MKKGIFLSVCTLFLVWTAYAEAVILQGFDTDGRLRSSGIRASSSTERINKYPLPDGAQLRTDVHYEFYPVFGKTFAEIVKSAEENGPRRPGSRMRQTSSFAWSLGWSYDFIFSLEQDEDNNKVHCDLMITEPQLSYDITITLPVLTDDSALNPMEKELWKNFFMTQLNFEHAKVKIVKDDTRDVILQRFGEVEYLLMSASEADNAAQAAERFIRKETEKIGSSIISDIRSRLDTYNAEASKSVR